LVPKIEKEVNKFMEAGFIHKVKYPTWIANMFLLGRKTGNFVFAWTFEIPMTLV